MCQLCVKSVCQLPFWAKGIYTSPSHHRVNPKLRYIYTREKRQPANDCLYKYSFNCCSKGFLYSFPRFRSRHVHLSCRFLYMRHDRACLYDPLRDLSRCRYWCCVHLFPRSMPFYIYAPGMASVSFPRLRGSDNASRPALRGCLWQPSFSRSSPVTLHCSMLSALRVSDNLLPRLRGFERR